MGNLARLFHPGCSGSDGPLDLDATPNQVNLDKLDLKTFYSIATPKTFIYCRQDKSLPSGYFHPQMSSRLGTFEFIEMDGSHEVLFTRPAELVDKLIASALA